MTPWQQIVSDILVARVTSDDPSLLCEAAQRDAAMQSKGCVATGGFCRDHSLGHISRVRNK